MYISGYADILQNSRYWAHADHLNYTIWMSTIGLLAWIIGYNIPHLGTKILKTNTHPQKKKSILFSRIHFKTVTIIPLILLLILISLLGEEFLTGSYRGVRNWGSGSTYAYTVFHTSILLATFAVIYKHRRDTQHGLVYFLKKLPMPFLTAYTLYISIFLLLGDRGGPVMLVLASLILYGSYVRPIHLTQLLLLIFIGLIVVFFVGQARNSVESGNLVVERIDEVELPQLYGLTLELSNSIRTALYAVDSIDSNKDLYYGKLMLNNALSLIPFGQTIYLDISKDSPNDISSSKYFTTLIKRPNANSGVGTSLIGDLYINFGILGLGLLMFVSGILFSKSEINSLRFEKIPWITLFITLSSLSAYIARDSYLGGIRTWFWILIIYYLTKIFSGLLGNTLHQLPKVRSQ